MLLIMICIPVFRKRAQILCSVRHLLSSISFLMKHAQPSLILKTTAVQSPYFKHSALHSSSVSIGRTCVISVAPQPLQQEYPSYFFQITVTRKHYNANVQQQRGDHSFFILAQAVDLGGQLSMTIVNHYCQNPKLTSTQRLGFTRK